MIHAYYVIFGAYGFWLPNDPRGSWSDFVGAWELVRFGKATKGLDRLVLTDEQNHQKQEAKKSLKYSAVTFTSQQTSAIGRGFSAAIKKSTFTVWACSILPEHVHLVMARHTFKAEYIAGLLKGEATKQLRHEGQHPFEDRRLADGTVPSPWSSRSWRVYLDSDDAIESSIRYVNENPVKEGHCQQAWPFLTGFTGLDAGWVAYY